MIAPLTTDYNLVIVELGYRDTAEVRRLFTVPAGCIVLDCNAFVGGKTTIALLVPVGVELVIDSTQLGNGA